MNLSENKITSQIYLQNRNPVITGNLFKSAMPLPNYQKQVIY
ncbi:hypothetical protein DYBT9623_01281 [Dyadobacter sp. CECT 9623]|uniref:Uncharacterized protein n=1 Tax=Dyadobacter linearis TaxID=2823330 RepID=A0ABM8UM63_9BACT|nr:hypothetical protein DYBT9623_01281 [Dyadobacter sp. CECT 9623]